MKIIIFFFDHKASKIFVENIDEKGNKQKILSSRHNFVYTNETVAKIIDVDEPEDVKDHIDERYNYHHSVKYLPIKVGHGIIFDKSNSTFIAAEYGFVRFDRTNNQISLRETLQIPKDKTVAYLLIHPTKFKKIPTYEDITEILINKNIHSILDKDALEEQLKKIDLDNPKIHRITIASGRKPVNGYSEYYLPLIDLEKKVGKILNDGRMDFKEIDSIVQIKSRQAILKKVPSKSSNDGYTIYGDKIEAIIEPPKGYLKGKNLGPSTDKSIFISLIDGCLNVVKKKVSISPIAIINGNIDYETGNINFHGSVQISGSILPGFTVKASDNVTVGKNIDDATIEAGGDIIVKSGIGGKGSTKITAGGKVIAKYVLNSTVEAKGEVDIEVSIINSNVCSSEKVTVRDRNGKILGGETMALHDITSYTSGGPKENKTILTVGKSKIIDRELLAMKLELETFKNDIEELSEYAKAMFGEQLFTNPKEYISILPAIKKKSCVTLLAKLSKCNKSYQELNKNYNNTVERYRLKRDPSIQIFNEVFPGTVINIKKRIKNINKKYTNVKFFEDNEEKVIRFIYAV